MSLHPLAEVFGFPADNISPEAERCRKSRLCPFNNKVANCTKDKANDPLGVCSMVEPDGSMAIICPIRFRQNWTIIHDAAAFFFPPDATWTSLTEVRLNDRHNQSAGNIDIVLVSYDGHGRVVDFGALEIQAVYISGNIRRPFEHYMRTRLDGNPLDWTNQRHAPHPDYLSSSRKRLAPQLIYKGGILHHWNKKQAVVLHSNFFNTLPRLDQVDVNEAEIAWLIYDLVMDSTRQQYQLTLQRTVYTRFQAALGRITAPEPGEMGDFVHLLQEKLDDRRDESDNLPGTLTLNDLL